MLMLNVVHTAFAATIFCAALAGFPALAETMNLKADLKGATEVPPVNTSGAGTVTATFDTASKKLSWQGTVSGLTGDATAAHFHGPAEPGKNAGVLVPAPGVKSGAFEGSATITDDQAKALMAGQTYFNIHTAANPQGEVRGQVTKGP
jgi:CHRD domain